MSRTAFAVYLPYGARRHPRQIRNRLQLLGVPGTTKMGNGKRRFVGNHGVGRGYARSAPHTVAGKGGAASIPACAVEPAWSGRASS